MAKLSAPTRETYGIPLFFCALALLATLPVFLAMDNWGIQDWDQHLFYHAVPRITILQYAQFPLWNPYYCGGTVLLANPQSRFLSPSFLLVLLFGEVRGIKLEIWLHLVIGLLGAYQLARYYSLRVMPAVLAASVFMLNSMVALNLTVGMTWFLSVAYLPWALLFYLRALRRVVLALVSGLFLVLMFLSGGAYPLAITGLFFVFYSALLVVFKEYRLRRVVLVLLGTFAFTLGLGAIKFFPTLQFLYERPRLVYDYSGYSLNSLQFGLFSRDQSLAAVDRLPAEQPGFVDGVTGGMDENGMYIGVLAFGLALLAIGWRDKTRMLLALNLAFFLWLSFGNRSRPIELWTLLHLLPVYSSMRIAQRFRLIFILCLAICAGFGLQRAQDYIAAKTMNPRLSRYVATTLLLVVTADLLSVSLWVFRDAFIIPPLPIRREADFHQVWELPRYDENGWLDPASPGWSVPYDPQSSIARRYTSFSSLYPAFLSNRGTINCYESAEVPRNAVPVSSGEYRGEVYLVGTEGTARILDWSPNRILVDVRTANSGHLVLNQNYYPGWKSRGEEQLQPVDLNGLLALLVSPSSRTVELHYFPASFSWGLATTCLTGLLGCLVAGLSARGRAGAG